MSKRMVRSVLTLAFVVAAAVGTVGQIEHSAPSAVAADPIWQSAGQDPIWESTPAKDPIWQSAAAKDPIWEVAPAKDPIWQSAGAGA